MTRTRNPSDTFATRLHALREQAGLSVAVLAAECGLSRQAIYAFERGRDKPTLETAQKLAAALGQRLECWEGVIF